MTRLILVAAGGLLLATASTPPPAGTTGDYPTCSSRVKDRCVQRHERSTYAAPRAQGPARPGGESELSSVVAADPPARAAASYAAAPAPRAAPVHHARAYARAARLAMRVGERG